MPIKTFAYRLYPTKSQKQLLEQTIETCRRLYNDCLAERRDVYESTGRSVTKVEQLRRVKEVKATNPYAKDVHSHILQVAVADLDKAFRNFFRRLKTGEKPGYPRFKARDRFDSFGLKEYGNGFRITGRRLKLSGIGRIAVRWHREIPAEPSTLRIIRKADGWYACFTCEAAAENLPATGKVTGLDVGIKSLITDSDGIETENPMWYRAGQKKLRVLQRSVARKKKGGSNRRKAVARLRTHHLKISRQRQDFLNKLAARLIRENDLVALEDLKILNMVSNHHLSKSILDAGWNYLVKRLTDKAAEAGRVVIQVNPANTSKSCSACGHLFEGLKLSHRWVTCPKCSLSLDRDHNAAINILNRGLSALACNRDGQSLWAPSTLKSEVFAQEAVGF
jgi:putative transposase